MNDAVPAARIETIERGYEFLLAYAAQGRQDDRGTEARATDGIVHQARHHLVELMFVPHLYHRVAGEERLGDLGEGRPPRPADQMRRGRPANDQPPRRAPPPFHLPHADVLETRLRDVSDALRRGGAQANGAATRLLDAGCGERQLEQRG